MSDLEWETEASTLQTTQEKECFNSQFSDKTEKKTKTKVKKGKNFAHSAEDQHQIRTARKQPHYTEIEEKKPKMKKVKSHQITNRKKQPIFVEQICQHTSVYKKFILSLFLSFLSMAFFSEPPRLKYPVANYQNINHEQVFQIVTDRLTKQIQFNYEHKKQFAMFVTSKKTARVKANVNYILGYRFQSSARNDSQPKEHVSVQMSNLEILSYTISDVTLENKEDGFWNTWTFEDHEQLITYIKENYIEEMKSKVIMDVPDQKRTMYEKSAQKMLGEIFDKYETWFDWLLKRIDRYLDVGLAPYVRNIEVFYGAKETPTQN